MGIYIYPGIYIYMYDEICFVNMCEASLYLGHYVHNLIQENTRLPLGGEAWRVYLSVSISRSFFSGDVST